MSNANRVVMWAAILAGMWALSYDRGAGRHKRIPCNEPLLNDWRPISWQ